MENVDEGIVMWMEEVCVLLCVEGGWGGGGVCM